MTSRSAISHLRRTSMKVEVWIKERHMNLSEVKDVEIDYFGNTIVNFKSGDKPMLFRKGEYDFLKVK